MKGFKVPIILILILSILLIGGCTNGKKAQVNPNPDKNILVDKKDNPNPLDGNSDLEKKETNENKTNEDNTKKDKEDTLKIEPGSKNGMPQIQKGLDPYIEETLNIIQDSLNDDLSYQTFPFDGEKKYDILNQDQKKLYDEMASKIEKMEYFIFTTKEDGYDVMDDSLYVSWCLSYDRPELDNYFDLYDVLDGDITTAIESLYYMPYDPDQKPVDDLNELKEEVKRFEDDCDAVVENMPKDLSTWDKYRYLATFISLKTNYDYEFLGGSQLGNPYGAIRGGQSICQGYSNGFYYLCKKANLWCERVEGESHGESHMWNLVKLDSGLYHIDITWSDELGYPDSPEWFQYFMITEEEIKTDHTIYDNNF